MQKSLKEEIKYLEHTLSENPGSMLFAHLADSYFQIDRIDDAIEICEQGVRKHPHYVTGHFILGKCYSKNKMFEQAEKEFKRVLLFDPKYLAAHREYAEIMAHNGWHTTCEMTYEEIFRIDPFNETAKQKFAELKKQFFPVQEQQFKYESESEDKDVEEKRLTDNATTHKNDVEEKVLTDSATTQEELELAEDEFKDLDVSEPLTHDEPSETLKEQYEDEDKDENANIDILEDIFRDNSITDLESDEEPFTDEDLDRNLEPEQNALTEEFIDSSELENRVEYQPDSESVLEFEKNEIDEIDNNDVFKIMPETQIKEPNIEPFIEETQPATQPKDKPQPPVENRVELDENAVPKQKEKIVTPTLGEIYAAQHQYSKAINVYEGLMKNDPDNEIYKQKIELLQKKLEESRNE